jgi:serine/threonine protein kinase
MPAKFIPIGDPAHDPERQALRFLVEGLPDNYTVYGNPWLVERSGVVYEIDAVVVAPHAIYVVEIKSYRGRIDGTDRDWYIPHPTPSPLPLNRKTAQLLKSLLKRESFQAGQVWIEGLIFLSATTDVGVRGPASRDRIHTRKTMLAALKDEALVQRLSGLRVLPPTDQAEADLLRLLTGTDRGPRSVRAIQPGHPGQPGHPVRPIRPIRRVREYEVLDTIDHQENFTELLARHNLTSAERLLRIYHIPPLATEEERERTTSRARWEAQVLGRLGGIDGILAADPPFTDEAGIVLPLEHFRGVSLPTWLERHGPEARGKDRADLLARTDLWLRVAAALDEAHRQGVVHRLLRPEVILVEDRPDPQQVRVTGFDLAKQLAHDATVSLTTLADDRLLYAAPEVVSAFSSAEPASDQFSLGALLSLLLTGKPLFESTRQLMATRRLLRRARDMATNIPLSLDEAVARMVELRPTDRYPSLAEAMEAVRAGRDPRGSARAAPRLGPERRPEQDPDNLEPGARVGSDYEITGRLGQGGMAVVYAARHLVSGQTRALKIARQERGAEEALRDEYRVLDGLDHPNIVRVRDLTNMIEGRLTLVMERVSGENLRQWLAQHRSPDAHSQRRMAEDLLAGLSYLEARGVTHKDLKPDNLLVCDGRLTIIDFSLAGIPEDAAYGGTPLYRDPASARFTHATDRFAAALCLFEIYAGRHAFEGHVPEPGQSPAVREDDIEPPGLAEFFRTALHPTPERRYPSARAMRDALLLALGEDLDPPAPGAADSQAQQPLQIDQLDASTPLRLTGLPSRAVNALLRGGIINAGQLLSLPEAQVRAIHAIGTKTATDILALQAALRARGIAPTSAHEARIEPPLLPDLADSLEPVDRLPLPAALRAALAAHGLQSVGAVASLTRDQALHVPGIGRTRLAQVVEALHHFLARGAAGGEAGAHTLDRIWEQAARPLSDVQRVAIERFVGITGAPEQQADIARDLNKGQPQVSGEIRRGLTRLDQTVLADLQRALDSVLDGCGGIMRLCDAGARFEEEWPAGLVSGAGILRLLLHVSPGAAHLIEVDGAGDGVDRTLLARAVFDRDTLRAFCAEVVRLAGQWPPEEPEVVRRALAGLLPHYQGDPLALGVRLCGDVQVAESGHLFIGPLDAHLSIGFVLERAREPFPLPELERRVRRVFGEHTPYPDADHLLSILRELDCQVSGETIIPGRSGSLSPAPALQADGPPALLLSERGPEEVVRDMLREAAGSRGFRMLVTPPELHGEIGRSVAQALSGTWLSFEDAFFTEHGGDLPMLERAERFLSQRDALTEAAEGTLFRLLEEHGRPGHVVVLGDTALFGICEALDLPRRLYDETLSGSQGFWVLVVPGVIYKQQPRFNEGPAMWHLEGATLPLLRPLSP